MKKSLLLLVGSVLYVILVTTAAPARISASSLVPSVEFSGSSAAVSASLDSVSHSVSSGNLARQDIPNVGIKPEQAPLASPVKPQSTVSYSSTKTKPVSAISSSPASPSINTVVNSRAGAIINTAKQYIGVPYVFGGTTPQGFDCSGFVQFVFAKNGISLPRVSRDQFTTGEPVGLDSLQPADLVFFSLAKNGVVDHVGIYLGGDQFINAASSKGVTIYTLGSYWKSYFIGAKREL